MRPLLALCILCAGCAYHNPTEATPTSASLAAPASLTMGVNSVGIITAHVQNLNGTPLSGVVVDFYADSGTLSENHATTTRAGVATITWSGHGTTYVEAVVGTLNARSLIVGAQ